MPEPAAIWGIQNIIFNKDISNTQNIILSQGREALKAIIRRILELGYELDVCTLYKECLAVLAVVFDVNGKSIKIEK